MDAPTPDTISSTNYSLWHIPSSTLLVLSAELRDIASRIQAALAHGCTLQDMMLEVIGDGDLIGVQHLGQGIADVVPLHGDVPPPRPETPGDAAVG